MKCGLSNTKLSREKRKKTKKQSDQILKLISFLICQLDSFTHAVLSNVKIEHLKGQEHILSVFFFLLC